MDYPIDDTELHWAAQAGDATSVAELIALGYPLDSFDDSGKTPLHYAAEGNHLDIVALLLEAGADVDARDERHIGNTPLGEVAATCSLEIATLLVDAGADPTIPGWMQISALDKARRRTRGDGPAIYAYLCEAARRRP